MLRAVASPKRPLVMFVDDLQWAGRTPLGFVDVVLSEEPVEGLLLVGAYRDDRGGRGASAGGAAVPLARAGRRAAAAAGQPAARRARPRWWRRCCAWTGPRRPGLAEVIEPRTRGNPYETVELLNALRRDGVLTATGGGWRWDAAAVRAHVGPSPRWPGCSPRGSTPCRRSPRQMVEAMACLGGRAELSLLQAATGDAGGRGGAAAGARPRRGLLVVEPGAHEAVRFRHDRIREAILGGLDPAAAAQPAAGAWRGGWPQVPELFAVAAEQYLPVVDAVDDADERRQVVGLLRRAADQAAVIGDYALVNALLAAALRLVDPARPPRWSSCNRPPRRPVQPGAPGRGRRGVPRDRAAVPHRAGARGRDGGAGAQPDPPEPLAEAVALGLESLRELGIDRPGRRPARRRARTGSSSCTGGWTTPTPPTTWRGRRSPTRRCWPRAA